MADPSNVYNNSVFTNYSSSVPANTPYVAAEIRSANYQPSMTFVLGDEEGTMSINDFPDLYRNGPLQQGSAYTAFVRAFPFPVAVSKFSSKILHLRIILAVIVVYMYSRNLPVQHKKLIDCLLVWHAIPSAEWSAGQETVWCWKTVHSICIESFPPSNEYCPSSW